MLKIHSAANLIIQGGKIWKDMKASNRNSR